MSPRDTTEPVCEHPNCTETACVTFGLPGWPVETHRCENHWRQFSEESRAAQAASRTMSSRPVERDLFGIAR